MTRQKNTGDNVGTVADPRLRLKTQTSVQEKDSQKSVVREYTEALLVALILAFFIRSFIVQAFKIPSGSMIPTLQVGDHILVNKFIYGVRVPFTKVKFGTSYRKPRRGEVIVFIYPKEEDKDFIKRIVAVEGDTVEI